MVSIQSQAKEVQLSAVITRANGTVEELGTIAYWNKNIFKTLLWRIKQWLR